MSCSVPSELTFCVHYCPRYSHNMSILLFQAELLPRVALAWHRPEGFIRAKDLLPLTVPKDGPAEWAFRVTLYKYLDERR